ncbi:MAG: hypothetical protein AAGB31_12895, partial [Bdellovibrio sp.]
IINYEHPAYNYYTSKRFSDLFYPNYLITFGTMALREIQSSSFIEDGRVLSCGHPYLDFISEGLFFDSQEVKHKGIVGVTLQWTDEDVVIPFINRVAELQPNITFILIPRIPNLEKYNALLLPANVHIERNLDFYSLLKGAIDIHCTTYSTCALEAPYMGIPNILIDFDKMATRYFAKVLPPSSYDIYVRTETEFIAAIKKLATYSPLAVRNGIKDLYSFSYKENLDKILAQVLRGSS